MITEYDGRVRVLRLEVPSGQGRGGIVMQEAWANSEKPARFSRPDSVSSTTPQPGAVQKSASKCVAARVICRHEDEASHGPRYTFYGKKGITKGITGA